MAAVNPTMPMTSATTWLRLVNMKSDPVSPIAVVSTLVIQNAAVSSGTLTAAWRASDVAGRLKAWGGTGSLGSAPGERLSMVGGPSVWAGRLDHCAITDTVLPLSCY